MRLSVGKHDGTAGGVRLARLFAMLAVLSTSMALLLVGSTQAWAYEYFEGYEYRDASGVALADGGSLDVNALTDPSRGLILYLVCAPKYSDPVAEASRTAFGYGWSIQVVDLETGAWAYCPHPEIFEFTRTYDSSIGRWTGTIRFYVDATKFQVEPGRSYAFEFRCKHNEGRDEVYDPFRRLGFTAMEGDGTGGDGDSGGGTGGDEGGESGDPGTVTPEPDPEPEPGPEPTPDPDGTGGGGDPDTDGDGDGENAGNQGDGDETPDPEPDTTPGAREPAEDDARENPVDDENGQSEESPGVEEPGADGEDETGTSESATIAPDAESAAEPGQAASGDIQARLLVRPEADPATLGASATQTQAVQESQASSSSRASGSQPEAGGSAAQATGAGGTLTGAQLATQGTLMGLASGRPAQSDREEDAAASAVAVTGMPIALALMAAIFVLAAPAGAASRRLRVVAGRRAASRLRRG